MSDQKNYNSNINTIWVSTTARTGSMWVFNVTREIFKVAGFNVFPSSIPHTNSEMVDIYKNRALLDKDFKNKYVLKVHQILKANINKSKILTTIRDPRDVCVSYKEFNKCDFNESFKAAKGLIALSTIYRSFDKKYICIIRYEDIETSSIEIILKISKFLEIEIDENKAKEISIKYSKSNIKKLINEKENEINNKLKKKIPIDKKEIVNFLGTQRVYDLKTGFQSNHISSRNTGDWKKKLDKSQVEILNKEFKDWLEEFGYRI